MQLRPLAAAFLGLASSSNLFAETAPAPSADDLELIVVSGRAEKPLKDVTGSISVVTSDEIEQLQLNDMNQLFQYEPGVDVTGVVGGAQNILVRGMGGDRVLIIKDGMRVNEGYGANGLNDIVGRGFIEVDTLKQVEVAKGAASSLYGSDALAGIVVFVTKDASDYLEDGAQFGGALKTGYTGITHQTHLSPTLAHRAGNFEQLLQMAYRDGEEQQNYHETRIPFQIESESLLYKARYNLGGEDFIGFSIDHWQQETEGGRANGLLSNFRHLASFGYNIVEEHTVSNRETRAYQLRYHSATPTGVYDQLNISLYRNESEQEDEQYARLDINAPQFGVFEIRDMWETGLYRQDTLGLLSNASITLNDTHTLGYGLDLERTESRRTVHQYREVETTTTRDLTTDKFPQNEVSRAGLFLNDEMTLAADRLTITPGLRYDWYDMDPGGALKSDGTPYTTIEESNLSLNLGALYRINTHLSAFAQYGQGFRVPAYDLAYIEHEQRFSDYIYQILPADDLAPETSDTFELGLRGHWGSLTFSSAAFYTKYDDFLQAALVHSERIFDDAGNFSHDLDQYQYQNIESVTIKGVELAASWSLSAAIELFANASYQHGKDDATGDYLTSISPLSGVVGASYSGTRLSSQLLLRWANRMHLVNDNETETAGFGTVDWVMGYQLLDQLSVNLAVNNLFDKYYVPYLNVAGRDAVSDLSVNAAPGRTFSASLRYTF